MRQGFRQHLQEYGKIAKEMFSVEAKRKEHKDDLSAQAEFAAGIIALSEQLDDQIFARQEFVGTRDDAPNAQQEVYDLQKGKQRIMNELRHNLRSIDNPEEYEYKRPKGSRAVFYDQEKGQYFVVRDNDKPEVVTLGAILTDGDWGINYYLDPVTSPRSDRKKYFVGQAKRELKRYLDIQITSEELSRDDLWEGRRVPYQHLRRKAEGSESAEGWISETMVTNFMRKLCIEHDLGFQIEEADVYQDVAQKIDFVMRRTGASRGIGVNKDPDHETIGIQFTHFISKKKTKRKKSAVERARREIGETKEVDDIVLVAIPVANAVDYSMREWLANGKPSGGPEQYWGYGFQYKVFFGMLKEYASEEEIEDMWKKTLNREETRAEINARLVARSEVNDIFTQIEEIDVIDYQELEIGRKAMVASLKAEKKEKQMTLKEIMMAVKVKFKKLLEKNNVRLDKQAYGKFWARCVWEIIDGDEEMEAEMRLGAKGSKRKKSEKIKALKEKEERQEAGQDLPTGSEQIQKIEESLLQNYSSKTKPERREIAFDIGMLYWEMYKEAFQEQVSGDEEMIGAILKKLKECAYHKAFLKKSKYKRHESVQIYIERAIAVHNKEKELKQAKEQQDKEAVERTEPVEEEEEVSLITMDIRRAEQIYQEKKGEYKKKQKYKERVKIAKMYARLFDQYISPASDMRLWESCLHNISSLFIEDYIFGLNDEEKLHKVERIIRGTIKRKEKQREAKEARKAA